MPGKQKRKPYKKGVKGEAAVEKWSNTPSPNPRYKGATPAEVGRALLGKPPVCHTGKLVEGDPYIEPGV